jgi:hypothetical protein
MYWVEMCKGSRVCNRLDEFVFMTWLALERGESLWLDVARWDLGKSARPGKNGHGTRRGATQRERWRGQTCRVNGQSARDWHEHDGNQASVARDQSGRLGTN